MKDRIKKKLILGRLNYLKIRIQPSKIHGVGLFAIEDIPENSNPFLFSYMGMDGYLFKKNELKKISKEKLEMLQAYYPPDINGNQYIPGFPSTLILTNYLNFDEVNPNIELKEDGNWRTLRNIKKGEELLENPTKLFNKDGIHKIFYTKRGLYTQIEYP